MISYSPLWQMMERESVSTYTLREEYKIPPGTIQRLKKDYSVTTRTLNDLCMILRCSISDIMVYVDDEAERDNWLNEIETKGKNG